MLSGIIKASHAPFERFYLLISEVKENKEWDNIEQIEGQRHAWDAWSHHHSRCFWSEKQVGHRGWKGLGAVILDGETTFYFMIMFQ